MECLERVEQPSYQLVTAVMGSSFAEDIQAAVEGSQGTVRDSQLEVDILAIVVGNLDIIGTHKAVVQPLAEVLPFST